jgi:hypothetical protein
MKRTPGRSVPRARRVGWLAIVFLACAAPAILAHSGSSLQAPLTAAPFSAIDGTIDAASGPERSGAAAVCNAMKLYALRTNTTLYLAVDVYEDTADPDDVLLLFFDMNHSGGTGPDAADRAIRLVGFPAGSNQTPTTAQIFSGNGTDWVSPAAFTTVKSSRVGSGPGGRLVVELTVPITTAPLGFAAFYASKNDQDCNSDGILDNSFAWPSTLPTPGGDSLAGIKDPSQWGDLGRRAPQVTFVAPTCCTSNDITFNPSGQPFTPGVDVNISANVHNLDTTFDAKSVPVEVRVHKFGTGGGVIFTSAPSNPVIPLIGHLAAATTSAVTWPSPPSGIHGCIQAEIQPPTETGGHTLDDYSLAASNIMAQHNIDVACVPQGMKKNLQFLTFNPDAQPQKITLVMQQQTPEGMRPLELQLGAPDRVLQPREEFAVTLNVTAQADAPVTKLPRELLHVPPTASGQAAVLVKVAPGDRVHLAASGDVDVDGRGNIPATGPDGTDASNAAPGQYLLSGRTGARVAGALIGSFDGFKTSFLLGADGTVNVPAGVDALQLAVNDIIGQAGDNTGGGYDVEAWRLPALNPPPVVIEGQSPGANPAASPAARPAAAPATGPGATAAAVLPPFPEIRITAASTRQIRINDKLYTLSRELGGVVYQLLVTDHAPAGGPGGTGGGYPPPFGIGWLWWLLLLLLLLVLIAFGRRKRPRV